MVRHDATYLDVWDFGNDVVGDGDEEWVGEASVDGEYGESELEHDVVLEEQGTELEAEAEDEEIEEIDIVEQDQAQVKEGPQSKKGTAVSSGYSSDAEPPISLHSNDHITSSWVSLDEKQK